jgi:hypothetical protein
MFSTRSFFLAQKEKNVGDVFGKVSNYTNPILTSKPF